MGFLKNVPLDLGQLNPETCLEWNCTLQVADFIVAILQWPVQAETVPNTQAHQGKDL